jgi:uncharacterized protein DUF2252
LEEKKRDDWRLRYKPAQASGYLGKSDAFDQAIADFAEVYADQAERDYASLMAAIKDGRVQAQVGL